MKLPRPPFDSPGSESARAQYAAHLSNAAFWSPYIAEALQRHGLPQAPLAVGAIGSFPTFLAGPYVVKLFCEQFDGAICYQSERAVLRLLNRHPAISAPDLIAEGALFGELPETVEETPSGADWPWPYLIMTRLDGVAWYEAQLTAGESAIVARQLGRVIRQLHALLPPTGSLWAQDWLAEYRSTCVERQRRFGLLPPHLIEQIDAFLAAPSSERRLIHADLHDHHLFTKGGQLTGIIDWGDAIVADPYHELPALHLHSFNADTHLLDNFLEAYGWPADEQFVRRAMTATLVHPFDVLHRVARAVDLRQFETLNALAAYIWQIP